MKIRTVYFDGSYPVPGTKGMESYFHLKPGLKLEELAHGIVVSDAKDSYFYPWVNISHMKLEVDGQNVIPMVAKGTVKASDRV